MEKNKFSLKQGSSKQIVIFIIVIAIFILLIFLGISLKKSPEGLNLSPESLGGSVSRVALPPASGVNSVPIATFGKKWKFDSSSPYATNAPSAVSIGNNGNHIFAGFGLYISQMFLFNYASVLDGNQVATPLWTWTQPFQSPQLNKQVDSADNADVHVEYFLKTLVQGNQNSGWVSSVRKFSSQSNGVIDWEYSFPGVTNNNSPGKSFVSNDGSVVVAYSYNSSSSKSDIAILQGSSGNVLHFLSLNTQGAIKEAALSGDGSKFVLISNLQWKVIDTATGSEIGTGFNFGTPPTGAIAIDQDGSRFVYLYSASVSGSTVAKMRLYDTPYTSSNYTDLSVPGNYSAGKSVAISNDGSRAVYGYLGFGVANYGKGGIALFDITTPTSPQLLINYLFDAGQTSLPNNFLFSMTPDGSRFVAGLWGDEFHIIPEIMVFNSTQPNPVTEFYTQGSITDLDISPDGKKLVVAIKENHATNLGSPKEITVFDLP